MHFLKKHKLEVAAKMAHMGSIFTGGNFDHDNVLCPTTGLYLTIATLPDKSGACFVMSVTLA